MEYLPWGNRLQEGDVDRSPIDAEGRHVVIIGGGDTGADCLGTAHRQGAASIHQFEIMPRPPDERPDANPWPTWPMVYRVSSAHEEGGERVYAINTAEFLGEDGRLTGLRTHRVEQVFEDGRMSFEPVEGSEEDFRADLVFLAMGFTGPEQGPLIGELGLELDGRGNVGRDGGYATNVDGVYVCGDMGRGQSLIVWAIAEGRSCVRRGGGGQRAQPPKRPPGKKDLARWNTQRGKGRSPTVATVTMRGPMLLGLRGHLP